jgi:hypothetical protein
MNGRITYFGKYNFSSNPNRPETSVFIELNSKLHSEGLGFPELLLPAYSMEKRLFNNYSFAKYNDGELVDRGGEYSYALSFNEYDVQTQSEKIVFQKWDQHIHCIQPSGKNMVVVSRKSYCISLSFYFSFCFVGGHKFYYTPKNKNQCHKRLIAPTYTVINCWRSFYCVAVCR